MEQIRVRIVHDDDYEIDGATGWGEPWDSEYAAETREKLDDGTWDVYGTIVEHRCSECGSWIDDGSLWGSVDLSGSLGTYSSIDEIPNAYLRGIAEDILS